MSDEDKKELEYLRYYYDQVYHALGPADDEINRDIAWNYEGKLPEKYKTWEDDEDD